MDKGGYKAPLMKALLELVTVENVTIETAGLSEIAG